MGSAEVGTGGEWERGGCEGVVEEEHCVAGGEGGSVFC